MTARFYVYRAWFGACVASALPLMATSNCFAAAAQDIVTDELARIYEQYKAIRENPDVATLVMLDERLRVLLFRDDGYVDSKYLRPEYESMGLEPTLFEPDYKVIRFELAGERIDYKYRCYQRFLSNRPREQLTIAQQSAILYYRKAIALLPDDRYLPDRLREMEEGPDNSWHYCAD